LQISAATAGAFACLLACGGGGGSESTEGTLLLPTSVQASGVTYRLSGATFEVEGAEESVTLMTLNPPSGAPLQSQLIPGPYSVELAQGYVLERQMGSAFMAVSGAMLTSMNPANVNLVRGQIATVGFVFDADGVSVDFAQGAGNDDDGNYD
jgi:hypothetical protein